MFMLPKIKSVELGKVHIDDEIVKEDFLLHEAGFEIVEKTPRFTLAHFEKLAVHDPQVVLFGAGFRKKASVDGKILDSARKQKIDVHVLSTPDALKKFFELSRSGKRVVAHIRVSE